MEHVQSFGDAIEHVMAEVRSKVREASHNTGAWESFKAFAAAVDWKEPWLLGLFGFHALLLTLTLVFKDSLYVSGAILALSAAAIYGGERINHQLSQHWKSFAGQPYFDKHGIFYGAVVSAPLLLIMFVLLINYLIRSSSLLIKLKRKELIHKARQRRAGGTAAAESQTPVEDRKQRKDK